MQLGKPIVPVAIEPVQLHGWYKDKLGSIQHRDPETEVVGEWYGKVAAALRRTRRATTSGATSAEEAVKEGGPKVKYRE